MCGQILASSLVVAAVADPVVGLIGPPVVSARSAPTEVAAPGIQRFDEASPAARFP